MSASTLDAPERPAPLAAPPGNSGSGRGWRAALRIARRTVRRNLGRSLLVAALVGVPVAGATLVDVLYRTFDDPERQAYRVMADGDALIEVTPTFAMPDEYFPSPHVGWGVAAEREPAEVDVSTLLPAGTTVVPAPRMFSGRVEYGDSTTAVDVLSVELGHDLTQNRARLVSGSWPDHPDEVLINKALADRLGLSHGDGIASGATVTLRDGPTLQVTGIGLNPFSTYDNEWNQLIFAAPDSPATDYFTAAGHAGWDWLTSNHGGVSYIAVLPDGTDVDALWPALAAEGVAMLPRETYLDPQRYEVFSSGMPVSAEALAVAGLIALIVGLGLLEVILLAGAAFAVSARRQVRELGLVSANGGTARQVRRIMYAQGFVLGVLGAVLGLVVGAAISVGGKPIWERVSGSLIDGWRFGWVELAIAAGVGVISGLAAAFVPARGAARLQPIDALAQRFRATPLTARLPRLGIVLIAFGAGGGLIASRVAAAQLADYAAALEAAAGTGEWVPTPQTANFYVALQLLGAVVAVAGLILTISYLITVLARRMRRAPLSAKYAVRDAARHRHRTTPAVAAIMIVVASATGLSIGIAGSEQVDRLRYQPSLPEHVMSVTAGQATDLDIAAHVPAIAATLPEATIIEHVAPGTAMDDGAYSWVDTVHIFTPDPLHLWMEENCEAIEDGYDCGDQQMEHHYGVVQDSTEVAIATPELIELAYGRAPDAETLAALESGALVVPHSDFADADGIVTIELYDWEPDGSGGHVGEVTDQVVLPTHVVDVDGPGYHSVPRAFVSEATATAHWELHPVKALITYAGTATADQLDAAHDLADNLGYSAYVETGPTSMRIVLFILAAGAGFVTLVGVGVTVALAAAEGRADLATMAAVGAPPRRRRAIAGWQALVVGGLGTALGLALGAYFAYLVWPAIGAPSFTVPWTAIALIGLAVPLLATILAVALAPSRLPMIKRIE